MTTEQSPSSLENNQIMILLKAIPEYSPGENLSIFIADVDNLFEHFNNRITFEQLYVVNFHIRSKIKGEARDYISYEGANCWEDIKKSLLSKYGDQRSEDILASNLTQCIQKKQESYRDYYGRILKSYNDLMQQVILKTDAKFLEFKKIQYSHLALKTFKNGILEPYREYLSHFELNTLEQCLNKCNTLDNQKQEWDYSEFLRRTQEENKRPPVTQKPYFQNSLKPHSNPFAPKPQYNSFNTRTQFQPFTPRFNQQPFFQKPQFQPFSQRPQFQPFAQRQQFQPFVPRPPFQPFAQRPPNPKPLPPPEPMSTQTTLSNNRPQQNPFHNPSFKFKELFNVESEPQNFDEQAPSNPEMEYLFQSFCEYMTQYDTPEGPQPQEVTPEKDQCVNFPMESPKEQKP